MFPLPVTGLFGKLNITLCACMCVRVHVHVCVCACVCMLTWCFMYRVNYCRKPKRASEISEVDSEVRTVHAVDLHLAAINTEGVHCVHVLQ